MAQAPLDGGADAIAKASPAQLLAAFCFGDGTADGCTAVVAPT